MKMSLNYKVKEFLLIFSTLITFSFLTACTQKSVNSTSTLLIHAKYLFDGYKLHSDTSLLISNGKIEKVAPRNEFSSFNSKTIDLGNSTLLPGFIELHAHLTYRKVPQDIVLQHGITTLRDVAGPIHKTYGGNGQLRILTTGPLLTAPNGYPIPSMGRSSSVIEIQSEDHARKIVHQLATQGATIIKVALEPGGEKGAPWSSPQHSHKQHKKQNHHYSSSTHKWPLLSEDIVKAITDEAHKLNIKVTAHIGEKQGAKIALNAQIDEWAHMPCSALPDNLLAQAVKQQVTIIGTLDTLSKCSGISHNTYKLAKLGAKLLYGAEVAHPDIPWGIDAQELMYMQHMAHMTTLEVLQSATSKSGKYLGIPLLGTLKPGAPADIIAINGAIKGNLKALEYPSLVISGGHIIKYK
ncbi:MAG: amidohydrolase family protein [Methyloprofundus sp.]|nr:amidohydrolase family protein [Methyloprofundus sp.]